MLPHHARHDDSPQTLFGIAFDDAFRAQEFMTAATRLASRESLHILDAVLVSKNAAGQTHVVETVDPQPGRSAISAGMWAGLIGLFLGGPVGLLAGGVIGAGAGAAVAKVVDLGVPDEWVEWFRQAVQPGTTAVVLLLTQIKIDALVAEAERFAGAELLYANLDAAAFDRVVGALGGAPAEAPEPVDGA
ncbi:MAG TPA: DUF1269 domain-containing protein [Ilumatobacteraceae bacterium]|jgi:uncharacterized membrane protein